MRRLWSVASLLVVALVPGLAGAQQFNVQEHVLDNGLTLLMVPRGGSPNVAAGWLAKVGSVNERPGITGISHLFEHMMFKGTRTIGTTDIEADIALLAEMDAVKADLRAEERELDRRVRLGEIDDPRDPRHRTPRHRALLERMADLDKRYKTIMVPNEFDRLYTAAGASSLNAGTSQDATIYFVNVPANKLELFFWLESDRLLEPVFREFYTERDVVREERRLRVESTPTGRFEEQFDSLFWHASPYGWPVIGWPSDVEQITREEALAYFDLNYAPNNLALCLVGDFDPAAAVALAERYFGRLERNPQRPPPVRTREVVPEAERRMIAFAETNPQADIRYLTVPRGHRDEAALVVLGALLSGRTGRLYKSLVVDRQVATSASAGQASLKWEGYFAIGGVAKPGVKPEDVEQALYEQIEEMVRTPVGDRELQKVKNQFAADAFRRLQNDFFLMLQVLSAENTTGWRSLNEWPKRVEAVTAAEIQRVAATYLTRERRAVALYYTKAPPDGASTTAAGDAALSAEQRAQVEQMRAMIGQMPLDQARALLDQIRAKEAGAPDDARPMLAAIRALLEQRLAKGGQR